MPKQECKKFGCHNLVVRGYCGICALTHRPHARYDEHRESAAKRGYGPRWKKVRANYLRSHPLCVDPDRQHVGRVVLATDLDHKEPHKGDMVLFWNPLNWQGLCHECHSRKTALEDGGFGNRSKG